MPFQSSYIAWYNVKHFKPSLKSTHAIDTVVFTCFLRILMNSCGLTSFEFITLAYWLCQFKCICMYTVYSMVCFEYFILDTFPACLCKKEKNYCIASPGSNFLLIWPNTLMMMVLVMYMIIKLYMYHTTLKDSELNCMSQLCRNQHFLVELIQS